MTAHQHDLPDPVLLDRLDDVQQRKHERAHADATGEWEVLEVDIVPDGERRVHQHARALLVGPRDRLAACGVALKEVGTVGQDRSVRLRRRHA